MASLPAILMLGAVIVEVAVASVFLLTYLNGSVYGTRLSNQSLAAARAGINDAILRVILDKNINQLDYTVTLEGATASVAICKDIFFHCDGSATTATGKDQIVATGTALTREHRVIAILSVDSTTGLVTIDSLQDQP